jgi:hypothetical protein
MNKLTGLIGAAAMAGGLMLASHAQAGPITFIFDNPTGNLGTSHTYTAGSPVLSVEAKGFTGTNTATDLFGKDQGAGEQGLGLANDPSGQNEITGANYIQLDVSGLFGQVASLSTAFDMNSTTVGETWGIFGSNVSGALGALLASGTDELSHLLPSFGSFAFYDFKAISGGADNVLLHTLAANQNENVPEPATLFLLSTGLVSIAVVRRKRRRAA